MQNERSYFESERSPTLKKWLSIQNKTVILSELKLNDRRSDIVAKNKWQFSEECFVTLTETDSQQEVSAQRSSAYRQYGQKSV